MSIRMLADAVRSETYRFTKNRMAVFWSVLFVPLIFAVGGIGYHLLSKSRTDAMAGDLSAAGLQALQSRDPVDLGQGLLQMAGACANGASLVFLLIGAATLYAGDYRWESWRLITARNSRLNLVLGKVGALKLLALSGMAAFLIAGLLFLVTGAVLYGRPLGFTMDGGEAGSFGLLLLLSYLRLVQYVMIALLTAVVTRSLLAALFVPVVLGFAQTLFGGPGLALLGWQPTDWASQLLLPGLAYDGLKAIVSQGAATAPDGLAAKGVLSLALWVLVPLGAALAWFQRQDLSKE